MATQDPISRVSVVSTGSVQIRPEHVGPTRKNTYLWLATSRQWTAPRPINVYVIEHRAGLVVFDTGQDRASVTDPSYFPSELTGLLYQRLAQFDIGPDQTLTRQLSAIGYDVAEVRTAVLSHLHQDHIGGLPELHHADIVVSEQEWKTLQRPLPALRGFLRSHTDLPGLRWHRVRAEKLGDHDLTPFDTGHVPGAGNKAQMRKAVADVNALRQRLPELTVLAAHDPAAADRLATALCARP